MSRTSATAMNSLVIIVQSAGRVRDVTGDHASNFRPTFFPARLFFLVKIQYRWQTNRVGN